MNQILYIENKTNDISKNNDMSNRKKGISIPMSIFVLPLVVLILVFTFSVYAKSENGNQNEEILANGTNNITNTQSLPIAEVIKETNETNDTNNSNTTEVEQETKDNKSDTVEYNADNGEKYTVIGKLNIPSLNIEYPILSSTSTELLKISLNKYWGANPNEVGNMVVVGHNYKNSKFFSKLPNIQIGEIVKITDIKGKTLSYSVYDTNVIDPYDNSCTSQLTDGNIEVTLITCYNNGKQRFVAKARAN